MCKKNNNHKSTIAHRAILAALTLIATLAAILIIVLAMGACTPEAIIDQPTTDPDTHGGTLIIGNINVGSTTSPTAAGTRIGIDDKAFATGDKIKVFADYYDHAKPGDEGSSTYAIYTLQADGSTWELDKTVPDNDPIIVEHIMAGNTPSIESWGGMAEQPADYSYTDQSTADYYRFSDLMTSTDATLSGRTLNANMRHMNVDVVVNITDVATAALPVNATLKLKRMSGNTPEWITAWNTGTTDGITTFRACVDVTDVPGIIGDIVTDTNLLGTLTYTPADGTPTTTLNIKYSIGDGTATTIKPGMRITINVPFVDLTTVTGTATVTDWNDTDGGEVGTTDIATSTGLDNDPGLNYLTAANPVWIVTGGTDANERTKVMTNVRRALTALNNNPNARIHLMLTGFAGNITSGAFAYCTALTTLSLPAATSIENIAFGRCPKLTRLELTGTEPITVADNAFYLIDGINNNNDGAKNVTLVLNESIKDNEEKQKAIGLKIAEDGKTVTFLKAISGTDLTDITVTFAAIDYLSS